MRGSLPRGLRQTPRERAGVEDWREVAELPAPRASPGQPLRSGRDTTTPAAGRQGGQGGVPPARGDGEGSPPPGSGRRRPPAGRHMIGCTDCQPFQNRRRTPRWVAFGLEVTISLLAISSLHLARSSSPASLGTLPVLLSPYPHPCVDPAATNPLRGHSGHLFYICNDGWFQASRFHKYTMDEALLTSRGVEMSSSPEIGEPKEGHPEAVRSCLLLPL